MPISIKDPEADRLARALADATGESITQAVAVALRERLDRVRASRRSGDLVAELADIASRVAALPVLDDRSDDVVLGYDDSGLPG